MPAKWQRLTLANQGDLPPILFKYSPTASGYDLYITDLTRMWSEHLNHQDILSRADDDDTTIDPSEDQEQFKVLLQKIKEALHNEPESSVSLHRSSRGDALELLVTSKLPTPLKPLKWRIHLSEGPRSSLTSHFLLPLIRAQADWEIRQQNLIEQLYRKDWILGKLFDKIDTIGIDLSTVFPGISGLRAGRKGMPLPQAAKYIKGLAPFNEDGWLDEAKKSSSASEFAVSVVTEISNGSGGFHQLSNLGSPADKWWEELIVNDSATSASPDEDKNRAVEKASAKYPMETGTDTGTETEDDEFERQETPPRSKKPSDNDERGSLFREDKKATLEDELKKKEKPLATIPPRVPSGKPKGLGMIGGKKRTKEAPVTALNPSEASELTSSKPKERSSGHKPPADENATDSESDGEENMKPFSPLKEMTKEKAPTKTTSTASRGLGVIGGKKKVAQVTKDEPRLTPSLDTGTNRSTLDQPSPKQPPAEANKKKPLGKLGVIGGKRTQRSMEPSMSSPQPLQQDDRLSAGEDVKPRVTPAKSPIPEERKQKVLPTEPPKEESEQEKADRKREELKRQLEAKSKAPVKKKRRF